MAEMQQLSNENADLHKACDFTLNNFEVPLAADVGRIGRAISASSDGLLPRDQGPQSLLLFI